MSLQLGEALALDQRERLYVSRRPEDRIWVQGDNRLYELGWGGTRNHMITWDGEAWLVHHLRHSSQLWINGVPMRGDNHRLASGDRVAPARGFVFTFRLRPDVEALAVELRRLEWQPASDARVLCDWVMERTGMDRDSALLASSHLTTRLAAGRTG